MTTPPPNANGHRRRQVRARVLAEETHCAVCDQWVDKTLTQIHGPGCDGGHRDNRPGCTPHPQGPVVDEIIARVHGGSPIARANTALLHRACNQLKGKRSLGWARAEHQRRAGLTATPRTVRNLVAW